MLEPRPYQKRAIDAAINLDYEKTMCGAGFMIRCHRCGKLKEPSQFRKLKPVWCTWCINCENTPIGMMPSN